MTEITEKRANKRVTKNRIQLDNNRDERNNEKENAKLDMNKTRVSNIGNLRRSKGK